MREYFEAFNELISIAGLAAERPGGRNDRANPEVTFRSKVRARRVWRTLFAHLFKLNKVYVLGRLTRRRSEPAIRFVYNEQ